MNDLILNGLGIACVAVFAMVVMYRLGPGLSDALSAWAKRQERLSARRLSEEWVDGFECGQKQEQVRQLREGV